MFSEELKEYITHGKEEMHIEYKTSMKWPTRIRSKEEKIAALKISKAMLALANNSGGGVIVVGVKEKNNGEFIPKGVSKTCYDSFKYDTVSRHIKNYSSAQIQFKIDRNTMFINGKSKKFVIIQVAESIDIPVVCTKTEKYDVAKDLFPANVVLRENAIYIRSKSPIESREISSPSEWRDLINRCMEKAKKELLIKMPCYSYIKNREEKNETVSPELVKSSPEFQNQLKKDNL